MLAVVEAATVHGASNKAQAWMGGRFTAAKEDWCGASFWL